jgi:O-antigen/teichoic acid export membrane protein
VSNKLLVKKFLEYALGSGIVLVLGFLSAPINTRLFNPEEFGQFSMFGLYTNIINIIVMLGFDQSFIRYFYEEENQTTLLFRTIKFPIILCMILNVIILFFWKWLSIVLFNIPNFKIIILLIITNFILVINRFSFLVIRMEQKAKQYSILQVLQKGLNILFVVVIVKFINGGFLNLTLSFVLSYIIATFVSIALSKDMWKIKGNKDSLKVTNLELFKFGYPLVFTFLITWLFQSADRVSIKYFRDYNELGLFSAAFSIIALLNAVQAAFSTFWVPVAYEHYEKNKGDSEFFKSVNLLVTFSMFLIGILLILFKDVIVLLLGQKFRVCANIMPFLVFMPIMYTISETTVMGINFKKKSHYHIIIAILSASANILGTIILVPKYGAVGAAISTGVSYIIFFSIRTFISNKFFRVEYYLKNFYLMTLSLSILALYATFNKFDTFYFLIGLINISLLIFLYRKIPIIVKIRSKFFKEVPFWFFQK